MKSIEDLFSDLAIYKAIMDAMLEIDSKPKNLCLQVEKGKEYEHMCFQLAQGYEMDWVSWPYILVNEFGEGEHVDAFKRRHPNFSEDVQNIFSKYAKYFEEDKKACCDV